MAFKNRYPAADEEQDAPLLNLTKRGLPKAQLGVLLLAYFTQPVACTVVYPFIAKLVAELDLVHGDTSKIGYYSGLFDALPLLTEALTVLQWTHLGQTYGRPRVLRLGALGVALSLTCFGFSKTLPSLIISRALQGALNANAGTVKTMIGEIAGGDDELLARAFSCVPIVWAVGSTVAPLVGGMLQHPAEQYPSVFTSNVWKEYPYLLPCLAAAVVPMVAFFAIPVLPNKISDMKRVSSYGTMSSDSQTSSGSRTLSRHSSFSSSSTSTTSSGSSTAASQSEGFYWTRTLIVTFLNYAIIVLLTSSFYALTSLFLASPVSCGGLGLEPHLIGLSMALMGLFHGSFQALFFVRVNRRVDPKRLFGVSMGAFGVLYAMMPGMNWLARRVDGAARAGWVVALMVVVQAMVFVLSFMGYCCMYTFVTRAAPNPESLPRTNGLSQIVYSLCAALGPLLSTILFAISKEHDILGGNLVYVVMIALSWVGVFSSTLLPSRRDV
ncbi:hypothetical protein EIP91_002930 [Steccherinum ochraceum]|uniref:Major facilitator superfamily (MFS) profile domain-containing protein n=1 Tax=Steccherinum ochraceum TaxID=92696 RepID=A0A4R0RDU8_9APHY|nr:hypothetical protein EIP91_002930 [Steccherinum ochraceum]